VSKFLIYHPDSCRICTGESLTDLAYATGKITFSPELRKVYVNGYRLIEEAEHEGRDSEFVLDS